MSAAAAPDRVLLVEDSPADAALVKIMLAESAPQLELLHAVRLGDALHVLDHVPVGSVLLDLGLPDADGLEALEAVLAARPDVPVVVLTGLRDEKVGVSAVAAGAQDFLVKDRITGLLLLRALRYAAERAEAGRARATLAAIVESSDDAMMSVSLDGTIRTWNGGAVRLYGYGSGEIVGHGIASIVPPGLWPKFDETFQRAAEGKRTASFDSHALLKGGTEVDVSIQLSPIVQRGKVTGVTAVARDATERSRVEAERERQAAEQAALVAVGELLMTGAPVASLMDRALAAAAEALGMDRAVVLVHDEASQRLAMGFVHPPDAALPGRSVPATPGTGWWRALAAGSRVAVDAVDCAQLLGTAGDSCRSLWKTITVNYRAYGGLLCLTSDPGREFADHQLGFVSSLANLIGSAVEREELDRLKDGFVSNVSHELRTPLTSVLGYLELLQAGEAGDLSDEQRQMLGTIERNGRRLQSLVEDLLTTSSFESRHPVVESAPVAVGALIDAAVDGIAGPLAGRRLDVEVGVEPDLGWVRGDDQRLERALLNLLVNAVKFTPDGGKVTITACRSGDAARITVTDTGIGIPEAEQAHVFERFFRASNARLSEVQGTGLGLSIAKSMVEGCGGEISVASVPGAGTTVVMSVPLCVAALGRST